MKQLIVISFFLLFTVFLQAQSKVDIEKEKTSIQNLFDNYSDAWKDLDIDKFAKMFLTSNDLIVFNTEKRFIGWDSWKESLLNFFKSASNVVVTFKNPLIYVHPSGEVAWLSVFEDADWMEDGESSSVKDMRVTWVLEKINGNWKVVQLHASLSSKY